MTPALAATATAAATSGDIWLLRWRKMVIDWVRSGRPDLSNRQLTLLLVVAIDPAPHTVRGLANYLNITNAAVSRAINRLEELEYLQRVPDRRDGRNVFVVVTRLGERYVIKCADAFREL